jgi:vacuolar-type H+-ATPase subunit F/Vma7
VSRAAAIGEQVRVAGYALAGVEVHIAQDADTARAAWEGLAPDVACLLLTPEAHAALAERLDERARVVWTVIPG